MDQTRHDKGDWEILKEKWKDIIPKPMEHRKNSAKEEIFVSKCLQWKRKSQINNLTWQFKE